MSFKPMIFPRKKNLYLISVLYTILSWCGKNLKEVKLGKYVVLNKFVASLVKVIKHSTFLITTY